MHSKRLNVVVVFGALVTVPGQLFMIRCPVTRCIFTAEARRAPTLFLMPNRETRIGDLGLSGHLCDEFRFCHGLAPLFGFECLVPAVSGSFDKEVWAEARGSIKVTRMSGCSSLSEFVFFCYDADCPGEAPQFGFPFQKCCAVIQ